MIEGFEPSQISSAGSALSSMVAAVPGVAPGVMAIVGRGEGVAAGAVAAAAVAVGVGGDDQAGEDEAQRAQSRHQ
jgi:hypothetical protein